MEYISYIIDTIIEILDKYNKIENIDYEEFKNEILYNDKYIWIYRKYNSILIMKIIHYIFNITGLKYDNLFKYSKDITIKHKNIYVKLHLNDNIEISQQLIKKFEFTDLYYEFDKCLKDYDYYKIYLNDILKYIIYFKKWDVLISIINNFKCYYPEYNHKKIHDYSDYPKLYNLLIKNLLLFPDNIVCKILNSLMNIDIKIIYCINNKINYTKYIPFDYFPLDKDNVLYTFMILLNDNYIKIMQCKINNNDKLIKFYNIFKNLHYDLQLKICGIKNIKYNDVRVCSMYLL